MTSRQNRGLKFGMVVTYSTYFRNIKRKRKVIFDHSTTLSVKANRAIQWDCNKTFLVFLGKGN